MLKYCNIIESTPFLQFYHVTEKGKNDYKIPPFYVKFVNLNKEIINF